MQRNTYSYYVCFFSSVLLGTGTREPTQKASNTFPSGIIVDEEKLKPSASTGWHQERASGPENFTPETLVMPHP